MLRQKELMEYTVVSDLLCLLYPSPTRQYLLLPAFER